MSCRGLCDPPEYSEYSEEFMKSIEAIVKQFGSDFAPEIENYCKTCKHLYFKGLTGRCPYRVFEVKPNSYCELWEAKTSEPRE